MTPQDFIAWREKLGYSKAQVAKHLGISLNSVVLYERGSRYEDNRPVVIPKIVELATEALTYRTYS